MCRHAIGANAIPFIALPYKNLRYKNKDTLSRYEATPNISRYFCNRCGASTMMQYGEEEPNTTWITVSTLDEDVQNDPQLRAMFNDPRITVASHHWTANTAPWAPPVQSYLPKCATSGAEAWVIDSCDPTKKRTPAPKL
eukprot:TRINITY_DN67501_c5_g3_i1.p1 TRINITY_DN67501_c5_g3~~TRINITY_DN67501_c5_g3_i1.p1  ORF type:complete len:139 (-),score=7.35 TRINITY_DN67501_c5_g3_i1:206-622(-)